MCQTKVCTKCGVEKDLEEFHNDRRGKYGRTSRCKRCVKQYSSSWYSKNVESYLVSCQKYKLDNSDRLNLYQKAYREKNRELLHDRNISWRMNNPDKVSSHRSKELRSYAYAKRLFTATIGLRIKDVPKELVEIKHVQLLIKRKVKEMKNGTV